MRPRALFVGNFLSSTRRYRLACEELAVRLGDAGWTILTTSSQPRPAMRLLDMVTSVIRNRRRYEGAVVDVFSGAAFVWAEAACAALRLVRRPYALTLRGGSLPTFARSRRARVRRLLGSARLVTAPSGYLREQMAPYRAELELLPNALDLAAYRYRRREQPRPELVWLRAFHEIYNPSLAPRVLASLRADFPEARLSMVGPDKCDGSMQHARETAVRLGVDAWTEMPGGVAKSEVPTVLDRADIFLNTTNIDNTPISVLEAMASGLCVVSTNVDGIPYLLQDGRDSLLVPADDAGAMSDAVRRILTEPGLAGALSENARAKAQAHDWSTVLPQWEELIARLCSAS